MKTAGTYPVFNILFMWKVNFEKKIRYFPLRNCISVVLPRNVTMLQQELFLTSFLSIISQMVTYGRKAKQYFKLLALKVVAVAYKRCSFTRGSKSDKLVVYKSGGMSQQRFDCNTFHISEILSASLSKAPLLEEVSYWRKKMVSYFVRVRKNWHLVEKWKHWNNFTWLISCYWRLEETFGKSCDLNNIFPLMKKGILLKTYPS